MGIFSSSNESNNSMKENKYVETIKATSLELLDKEITKRMEKKMEIVLYIKQQQLLKIEKILVSKGRCFYEFFRKK